MQWVPGDLCEHDGEDLQGGGGLHVERALLRGDDAGGKNFVVRYRTEYRVRQFRLHFF